jgi:hypothetical protein
MMARSSCFLLVSFVALIDSEDDRPIFVTKAMYVALKHRKCKLKIKAGSDPDIQPKHQSGAQAV